MEACLALANKTQKEKSDRNRSKSHDIILSFLPLSCSLTTGMMPVPLLMAVLRSALGRKFAWRRPCVFLLWCGEQSFAALGLWLTENVTGCFVGMEWEASFHEICYDVSLVFQFCCSVGVKLKHSGVNAKTPVACQDFASSCWVEEPMSFATHSPPPDSARVLSWFHNCLLSCLKPKTTTKTTLPSKPQRMHCLVMSIFALGSEGQ